MDNLELEGGIVKPRRRRKRPNVRLVVQMRQEMHEGLSIEEAAEKYDLPYFTVYQIRRGWTYKDAGGPVVDEIKRKHKLSAQKAERLRLLKKKGATIDQLCAASGFGRTAVKKALAGEI